MTYGEAIQFLYNLRWFGTQLGLENTRKLAALAGNPQEQLRFIHVAGTNGKGSTCAMLESIYRASGLRIGLFTSPHLVSFRERIQVNRQLISEAEVIRLVEELRDQCRTGFQPVFAPSAESEKANEDRRDAYPTFFEFVTVMALRYFVEHNCKLVVWETGLGGRLDATNIVTPLASVITNIGFDHQQWLGETLAKIACEKAGIIKPGVPVITAAEQPEALETIRETALSANGPLTVVTSKDISRITHHALLPLFGDHQKLNATVAIATVEALQHKIPVSDDAICLGLESVQWPGRFQVVTTGSGRTIVLDGAHNVAGATALKTALQTKFPGRQPTLILGVLQDKDWSQICAELAPLAERILLVPVSSERSASPETLRTACATANPGAQSSICVSLAEALEQASSAGFVLITGSLYLVGQAMELLGLSPTPGTSERELNEWSQKK
jgi:dihydrofolate synthase/folylpolyglutamate synthase